MTTVDIDSTPSVTNLPDNQEPPPHQVGTSLWSLLDDRLRGRWRRALLVGMALAGILGPAGYLATQPKYQSLGFIRIAPKIEPILRETAETSVMPFYDGFVRTQAELLASRRVLERALVDESLAASNCTVRQLQRGLRVTAARNTELISVQFNADSPQLAQIAVNAVLDAYYEIFGSAGGDEVRNKLETLRARQRELRNQLREKRAQLIEHARASEYGAVQLDTLIRERVAHLDALEYQIGLIEHILGSGLLFSTESAPTSEASRASEPTPQQLDVMDPELASLRNTWRVVSSSFEHARERWMPTHPTYQRLEQELALIEQKLEAREAIVLPRWEAAQLQQALFSQFLSATDQIGSGSMEYTPLTRRQIDVKLEGLKSAAARARQKVQQISEDQRERTELSSEAEYLQQDLAEIEDRIMYLEIEENSLRTGRVSIAARGDRPVAPARDRRSELAAVGVIGGFGLSFGFFFLLGTVDRRAYGAAQLRTPRIPRCLGVLPDLGRSGPDRETCTVAAHCVHQIRNHIDVLRREGTGFVLAVSSPYQGDGKTNIVMALGWSYATAGSRTLLVDCDLTGQSLSRQLGMGSLPGLREVLRHKNINGQITEHRIPNMSILPAGIDSDFGPEMIRASQLQATFQALRQRFDVIIVDTGPVLASLEGMPVVAAADNTILSVRRGRRRALLEECVDRLHAVGASCLGIVLNCAPRSDCDRYVSKSSLSLPGGPATEVALDAVTAETAKDPPVVNVEHGALVRAMNAASSQTRAAHQSTK